MAGNITAILGLKGTGFKQGLDKAKADATGFKNSVGGMFSGLGGKLAGAFTVAAVAQGVKGIIDFGGQLDDTRQIVDLSVESLQELRYAFLQNGAGAEDVDKSLIRLTDSIASARNGSEQMIGSFARLGVTWEDLQTLSNDEILMKMADGFKGAADQGDALAAVLDTMGKGGAKMAVGLAQGSAALNDLRDEIDTLSSEDVAKLAQAGDKIDAFFTRVKIAGARLLTGGGFKLLADLGLTSRPDAELPDATQMAGFEPKGAPVQGPVPESPAQVAARKAAEELRAFEAEQYRQFMMERGKMVTEQQAFEREQYVAFIAFKEEKERELQKKLAESQTEETKKILTDQLAAVQAEADERRRAIDDEIAARQARIDAFVEEKLGGPDAARQRKREERKARQLAERAEREEDLRRRGGKAEQDLTPDERRALQDQRKVPDAKRDPQLEELVKKQDSLLKQLEEINKKTEPLA